MNFRSEEAGQDLEWRAPSEHPVLEAGTAHVWRIALDRTDEADSLIALLSVEEQVRARRFHFAHHRTRFVVAHAALRRILAGYTTQPLGELQFVTGEHGKPSLVSDSTAPSERIEFNLSHSADLALLAVMRGGAVGVDVEKWDARVEHLEVAERFFSPRERDALLALRDSPADVIRGFFSAWSRKEAYLKAIGCGITRGLHHFDVSLTPGEPAMLIADRLDAEAVSRWRMTAIAAGDGYSAALVAAAPLHAIHWFDVG